MRLAWLTAMGLSLLASVSSAVSHAAVTFDTIALKGNTAPGTGVGVIINFLGLPVINDAGQTAFLGDLTGTGVNFANDSGIFSEYGGALRLIAREGDIAPDSGAGVQFIGLGNPVLNNAGQTAFLGILTGAGVDGYNDRGFFAESGGTLRLVARTGTAAPDTGEGVYFKSFSSPSGFSATPPVLNNAGQTAFLGFLAGTGVDGTNDRGIFAESDNTLELIARRGDAAPGTTAGVNFDYLSFPVLNDAGQTAFRSSLIGTGVVGTNNEGIFSGSGDALRLVARRGAAAPGTGLGVNFDSLGIPVLNNTGQTAFRSFLSGTGVDDTNNQGIFSESGGTLHLVAHKGDKAPNTEAGVNFDNLGIPVLNNAGQTAFLSVLTGAGVSGVKTEGIFSESGGTLHLVAREGTPAPGTGAGVNFRYGFSTPVLNDSGQIAFLGFLAGTGVNFTNDQGIFATDLSGTLHLIVREGDLFDVNPDPLVTENRTIQYINFLTNSGGSDERTNSFNNAGQLVFQLVFSDDSEGIFIANTRLPGDLNGDGFVGIADLNIVLGAWNQNIPPGDPLADPSGDDFVGIADLNIVLGNWNAGTPPIANANIPELTSAPILLFGTLAMLRRVG